ncbi:glutaredoxin-2, mitochondrial-like protein [Sarcoptes scabiei]|uniref:Glutaredoxin-2, mitochondrial-like protein n=1 Tax=Sarcoptes scabiei TaxID=52283 RepID=A0A131ZY77_SARSC|nr:glutaredoxin-2, mitochondrial-like protein [Sarcoptes scabiei]
MARFEINERVKDFVDKKIASRKVVIFSKTTCPFCINAKKIFEEYQIDSNEIESIEIENDPDCSEIQSYLKSITGASTVPRVFINGQCIGGCNDTVRLHQQGTLSELLSSSKSA